MVWVWCTGDGADLYDELKGRWLGNTSLYEMDDSLQRIPSHTMGAENLHFLSESGPVDINDGAKCESGKNRADKAAPCRRGSKANE